MRHVSAFLLFAGPACAATPEAVTRHHADLALAGYEDSLTTAQALQDAVTALIATPSDAALQSARTSHFHNGIGIRNVHLGTYTRIDGSIPTGPVLADPAVILTAVDALVTQTASIDRATTALGLSKFAFEGSDRLDSPEAVFQ